MGMLPPISQPAYSSHNKLLVVSQKEREASCSAAFVELCNMRMILWTLPSIVMVPGLDEVSSPSMVLVLLL